VGGRLGRVFSGGWYLSTQVVNSAGEAAKRHVEPGLDIYKVFNIKQIHIERESGYGADLDVISNVTCFGLL